LGFGYCETVFLKLRPAHDDDACDRLDNVPTSREDLRRAAAMACEKRFAILL
jgi:hypothetical protein